MENWGSWQWEYNVDECIGNQQARFQDWCWERGQYPQEVDFFNLTPLIPTKTYLWQDFVTL